ncbi:MAG: sigma-70 family RNA polymerase sigma factor [Chloroflexota bacterium]|nr:sigma-70 family RNA polymerase sigma factor [Chloroflexota bacterium]
MDTCIAGLPAAGPGVWVAGAESRLAADADTAVVARMVAGDPDALGELYDRYGRVVFGVISTMLRSPEAAEEVCQDAFHRLWRGAGSYRPDRGSVRTWLLTIARNAAIDWRRTKGTRVLRETELSPDVPTRAVPVEDLVLENLRADRTRELLAGLPPDQRLCLTLAFWGGLSHREISAQSGVPLGTVKSRVRLGMGKLRSALLADGYAVGTNR